MSILQSETVARYLDEANITYQLLNAKSAEQEADLIATAGQKDKLQLRRIWPDEVLIFY